MKKTITVTYAGIKYSQTFDTVEKPLYTKREYKWIKKKVNDLNKKLNAKLLTEAEKSIIKSFEHQLMMMDKYFAVMAKL